MIPTVGARCAASGRAAVAVAILAAAVAPSTGGLYGGDIDPLLERGTTAAGSVEGDDTNRIVLVAADTPNDPLEGTERMDAAKTGPDAAAVLAKLLPPRTDTTADWIAPLEPLHFCGEPRVLPTCVPPPPCHPSLPRRPLDLVGVRGGPTCGPIYRGPCAPRTGSHDHGPLPRVHRVHDKLFDWFYNPHPPIVP